MAISPKNLYPSRVIDGDGAYPYGKALNVQNGVEGTGTPLEAEWLNDIWGSQQALLAEAGISPNGQPDSVGNSQYLDALKGFSKPASSISTLDGRSVEDRLTDLPDEVDAAGTAATLIEQHNSDVNAHPELSAFITSEADRAEAAADAASLNAGVYETTAEGIAATVDGDYFSVASSSDDSYLDLYKNDSGSALFIESYPSSNLIKDSTTKSTGFAYTSSLLDNFSSFDVASQEIVNLTDGAAFSGGVVIDNGMDIDLNTSGRNFIFSTGRVNTAKKLVVRQEIDIETISGTCNLGLCLRSDTENQIIYYGSNGWFAGTDLDVTTGLPTFGAGDSIYLEFTFDSEKANVSIKVGKVGNENEFSFVVSSYLVPEIWILQRGNIKAKHNFLVESINSLSSSTQSFSLPESTTSDLSALNNMLSVCQRKVPEGFEYAPEDYKFYEIAGKYFANVNLTNPVNEDDAIVLHVDIATGNDSNNGSSENPLQSIGAAFDLITTEADAIVKVKGGLYSVDYSWRGRNRPSKRMAVISWDGEPVISSLHEDGLSWSLDTGTTYTATYTESISTVFDSSILSADGDYLPVTKVDDAVTCRATENSYFNDSANKTLYVNLTAGRVPDIDVRAYRFETFLDNAGGYNVPGGLIYIENIHFEGGRLSPFLVKNSEGDNKITVLSKDCSFKYGGADGFDVDGYVFAIFQDNVCAWNGDDGFNYHTWANASPAQTEPNVVIEVGCIGRWNGRDTEGTNNGSTMHDGGVIIRVNGNYHDNQDRNVHDISTSYTWNLGCTASNSQTGNSNFCCGINDTETGKMWLDGCTSFGSPSDIEANGTLVNIYTFNFTGDATNIGNGTIQSYIA